MTPQLLRPPQRQADLQRVDAVRVTGVLDADAELRLSIGATPTAWLMLHIVPPQGLPYLVQHELGTDPAEHFLAQARLVGLRRGALVSATGGWLRLRTDHGQALLVLEGCTAIVQHAPGPAPGPDPLQENPA